MSSASAENRAVRSGSRKFVYAMLLTLIVGGAALYFRWIPNPTALAANTKTSPASAVRTRVVAAGEISETIRLTGTVSAERFQLMQAPQLLGRRGAGATVGNIATTTTPSSAPTFTPSNSSSLSAGNRFGDRQASRSAPATPYTPPSSAGSVYSSLVSTQSLRGSGDSDFNLTILKLAAPGQHVKKGEEIAEFDRQIQLLRLDDYKDTVIQLNENIEKIRSDLQTTRKAHDQMIFAAKAALDKAQLDLKTAPVRSAIAVEGLKLAVEETKARYQQVLKEVRLMEESQTAQIRAAQIDRDQAKMELDRAQQNVNRMVVRAPMDGIAVLQTIWRGGEAGPAQQGDQLYSGRSFMEVIDPRSMMLNATVNQVDAQRIRIGMKAKVHLDAYPNMEFPAHVTGVNALSKPSYRRPNFKAEIDVRLQIEAMDDHVIPDISGSADVVLESEPQATLAPLSAVFSGGGSTPFVYRQTPAGWERREVTLGLRNNTQVSIRAGLQPGDVIALSVPPSEIQSSEKQ